MTYRTAVTVFVDNNGKATEIFQPQYGSSTTFILSSAATAVVPKGSVVRVVTTGAGYLRFSSFPKSAATIHDMYVPANNIEYFKVGDNDRYIAHVTVSSGTAHITLMK